MIREWPESIDQRECEGFFAGSGVKRKSKILLQSGSCRLHLTDIPKSTFSSELQILEKIEEVTEIPNIFWPRL